MMKLTNTVTQRKTAFYTTNKLNYFLHLQILKSTRNRIAHNSHLQTNLLNVHDIINEVKCM